MSANTKTVEVVGISQRSTKDGLEAFFESAKRTGGGDIEELTYEPGQGRAVIVFKDADVCQQSIKFCANGVSLDGATLTVTAGGPMKESAAALRTIEVLGINRRTTEDGLEAFFENHKRTGGGDIEELNYNSGDQKAFIKFKDESVWQRCTAFCADGVTLDGSSLTVRPKDVPSSSGTGSSPWKTGGETADNGWQASVGSTEKTRPGRAVRSAPSEGKRTHGSQGSRAVPDRCTGPPDAYALISATPILEESELIKHEFRTVELRNIPHNLSEDHLRLLIEDAVTGDAGFECTFKPDEQRALLKFQKCEDAWKVVMSPLEVEGSVIQAVPLNTMLGDNSDFQGTCALLVSNIPHTASTEHLRLLFRNVKQSGGGDIEEMHGSPSNGEICFTFKEARVAQRVMDKHLKEPIRVKDQELRIRRLSPASPPPLCLGPKEVDRLLMTELPEYTSTADIRKYLKKKKVPTATLR